MFFAALLASIELAVFVGSCGAKLGKWGLVATSWATPLGVVLVATPLGVVGGSLVSEFCER